MSYISTALRRLAAVAAAAAITSGAVTAPANAAPHRPLSPVSQQNAIDSAQAYLEMSPFSASGLVKQLEYEGYSTEDATYAVNSLGADWNRQAARSAKAYLEMSPFSRSSLTDQLIYEGFTESQAAYGVSTTGL